MALSNVFINYSKVCIRILLNRTPFLKTTLSRLKNDADITKALIPIRFQTQTDDDWDEKVSDAIKAEVSFGDVDFANIASWLFASSLSNHRVVHQRIDEGTALWRAVKNSGGPILEVGRAAGGSTVIILGASQSRQVVSVDRAPFHAWCADEVFQRPDVKNRLKLYVQTSREDIPEQQFGMLFIDADHSYEGICHDIATFWNKLKPMDGRKAIAVFHDGAANPISFVEPVKHACDELLLNSNVARKIEGWGSMLVLEKLGDINTEDWFSKQHIEFWQQFSDGSSAVFDPEKISANFGNIDDKSSTFSTNILGNENFEDGAWTLDNLTKINLPLNADNPVRLFKETKAVGEHALNRNMSFSSGSYKFTYFIRPLGISRNAFSIKNNSLEITSVAKIDLQKNEVLDVNNSHSKIKIFGVQSKFQCGFFRVTVFFQTSLPKNDFKLSIHSLDGEENSFYPGKTNKGFFINLMTLRKRL